MAAKYPNNLIVQVNKPLDEKLVCEKLSDLTEYLYVGLLTYQKLDGKYYYVKSIDGGVPTWEELKTGATGSVIPNLLKNTNFGDGFNGWTTSGTVTIKDNVYEGLGVAEIGELAKLSQSVRLTEGRYTLSFRAGGELGRDYPLIVNFVRANIADITTDFYKTNTSVFVTEPRDLVTISFTVTSESDMDIQFESTRYVYLIDSIRLDEGDTANAYDEYLMQKRLVPGLNMATINGQSLLGGGDITISGGGGAASAGLSGQLSLVDLDSVKVAQKGLIDNEVRFYVIADSEGRLPSKQKCYDATSEVIRQLSLKTGNAIIDALLDNMEVEPIGVCVGDLIAVTKVPVSIADLANNFGITIPLSGTISIFQYKILHTNGARVPSSEESIYGVDGLLKGYDKMVFERSSKPTKYGYGTPLDECLESGVLAYTSAEIGGITANWSVFVDCAATPDGSGYYHLFQKAVCRDEPNTGKIFERFGYYHGSGAMPPSFTGWKENGGAGVQMSVASHGILDFNESENWNFNIGDLSSVFGYTVCENGESEYAVPSYYYPEDDFLIICGIDYTYTVSPSENRIETLPTHSMRYALKNVINFGIKDYGILEADKGMTWSDWCDSKYNTIGLSCTLLQVSVNGGQNSLHCPSNDAFTNVSPNDIIYPTLYFAS